FRDFFRTVKAHFHTRVLGISENNSLSFKDGQISKIEKNISEASIKYVSEKFNFIYDRYIKESGARAFFIIVPDKNYYFSKKYETPSLDYEKLFLTLENSFPYCEYIDITRSLSLDDYYKTDTHLRQERLLRVQNEIDASMGTRLRGKKYDIVHTGDFLGVLAGQSAMITKSEPMYVLENDVISSFSVYDYELGEYIQVYDAENTEKDGYGIFLGGTRALLKIENESAPNDKTLIVFRDSFGSVLSPLLSQEYKETYVVDIRYISSDILWNYLDFENSDVLFVYSTLVLNNGFSLK
ncbi:MAG: hypothetical protein KBS59_01795, partial [Clostridiales bacterium]|nr:hypothetical protein [Clostridiales bacterium]